MKNHITSSNNAIQVATLRGLPDTPDTPVLEDIVRELTAELVPAMILLATGRNHTSTPTHGIGVWYEDGEIEVEFHDDFVLLEDITEAYRQARASLRQFELYNPHPQLREFLRHTPYIFRNGDDYNRKEVSL